MNNSTDTAILETTDNLFNTGKYSKAAKTLENAIKARPDDLQLLYKLAQAYFLSQNVAKTIETLDSIIELNSRYDKAYYLKAKTYYSYTDNKEKTTNAILQALKINPVDSFNNSLAAQIFFSNGNYSRAQKLASDALQIDPDNYEAHFVMGAYFEHNHEMDKAGEHYQKALDTTIKYPESFYFINFIQQRFTENRLGYKLLKEAYKQHPDIPAYKWLFKRAYLFNHFLNAPFAMVDKLSLSIKYLAILLGAFIILVGIMYYSQWISIAIMEAFKWFSSIILILFVPYQLLIFIGLNIYFELVKAPKVLSKTT